METKRLPIDPLVLFSAMFFSSQLKLNFSPNTRNGTSKYSNGRTANQILKLIYTFNSQL